jgi:hypothetical protein
MRKGFRVRAKGATTLLCGRTRLKKVDKNVHISALFAENTQVLKNDSSLQGAEQRPTNNL